jgi:hypothetical protein
MVANAAAVLVEEAHGSTSDLDGPGMDGHRDSAGSTKARRDRKGKRRRQQGGDTATAPADVAERSDWPFADREDEWLVRLASDPSSSAAIEREIRDHVQREADLYIAGLRAKASGRPANAAHLAAVLAVAGVPLRSVENKRSGWWSSLWSHWLFRR